MARLPEFFSGVSRFQWDEGNTDKNWRRHRVTQAEAEQVFFNEPIRVTSDAGHSETETRLFALGRTNLGRLLAIVSTIRGDSLRVISARPMGRSERRIHG
jgi:uncharacterized DUF497 family protein